MKDNMQSPAPRVSFLEVDPCLTGLVRSHERRTNLDSLETQEISAYESAMVLARLLTPEVPMPWVQPEAETRSSLDMLAAVFEPAS